MTRNALLVLGIAPGLGLAFALASVASADPNEATQTRSVSAFHAVDLAGTMEVHVTVGKPISVAVTGTPDLLDKVTTTVKDGVLIVNTTKELNHLHRRNVHLRADVSVPTLDALSISGTGAMKVAGIANDALAINLSGTGALTATGSTGALRVDVGGTGEVSAKDLAAKDVVVDIGGTGAARLTATRSLEAKVTGTGSVDVHGHPAQVKKSVSGLGSIHVH